MGIELDFVVIPRAELDRALDIAHSLGFIADRICGFDSENVDIACRHAGIRGNHEPRWTASERLTFIRRFND